MTPSEHKFRLIDLIDKNNKFKNDGQNYTWHILLEYTLKILFEHYGDRYITIGNIALDYDVDLAWIIAQRFQAGEKKNILRTIFPSLERAFKEVPSVHTGVLHCFAIIEQYVTSENDLSYSYLQSIYTSLSFWLTHYITNPPIKNVIQALIHFIHGLVDPSTDQNYTILTLVPASIRIFILNEEEETKNQILDICKIYPPIAEQESVFSIVSNALD